jgi:hypothetical protein
MEDMHSRPKRLELKKHFQPLPREEGDEFFPNGIFEFNITKLLSFISANPSRFPVEEISVRRYAVWEKERLNENTVETANLAIPIALAEISPGRFNVIDGNHRLEKARLQELEKIPAYTVRAENHIAFLTSEKAYQSFVKYWNSKIDEMEP